MHGAAMLHNILFLFRAFLALTVIGLSIASCTIVSKVFDPYSNPESCGDDTTISYDALTCNKYSPDFKACVISNFPVGSPVEDLQALLRQSNFSERNNTYKNEYFYLWKCHNIANYATTITVRYNSDRNISDLQIWP